MSTTGWHIREAIRHLATGGVIAYPTETVYGLGCNPFDAAAVLHLLALKQRSPEHGVILIGNHLDQFRALLEPLDKSTRQRIGRTGSTPVTWILPCRADTPVWLTGRHDSLAIRVTRNPLAATLCEYWGGPLVSTSANIHGRQPAISPLGVRMAFNDQLDYILHDTTDAATHSPSMIRDGLSGEVLRS